MIQPLRFTALGALLLSSISAARAQAPADAPVAPRRVVTHYFTAAGDTLPTAAGAHHRAETTYRDSIGGVVRHFHPSGEVATIIPYVHIGRRFRHGVATSWYSTGAMKAKETYLANELAERLTYFSDGRLRRREQYQNGQRTVAECFGPDGQAVPFSEYERMPEFRGGMEELMRFLGRNIRYPAEALRMQAQGKVFVKFVVDTAGTVTDVTLLKGVHPALDAEAVRVMRQSPPWQPGRRDGDAVPVRYVVPVTFVIRDDAPQPLSPVPGSSRPNFPADMRGRSRAGW